MRWPWQKARLVEPRPMVGRAQELETAKEILAEVFHARPGGGQRRSAWGAICLIL
jgi:hypothetical protein